MNNTCNGIMNVYKERGFTSHDVVARLRGICQMKKIGHTGTLDPEAVGVLPVCFGSGTKLCDMITDWDKEYVAVLRLGVVTDTQDMTGRVLADNETGCDTAHLPGEEAVREAVMRFVGEYDQIPPMYSAVKVNGRRLYELARAGVEVERKPRRVRIGEIEIRDVSLPLVTLRVVCSKGTYIRTLCHDIGLRLGCGGAMESLARTRVGSFRIENALKLSEIERLRDKDKISDIIISPDVVLAHYRAVRVNAQGRRPVLNGNLLTPAMLEDAPQAADGELFRVYDAAGVFYGVYRCLAADGTYRPVKMFPTEQKE